MKQQAIFILFFLLFSFVPVSAQKKIVKLTEVKELTGSSAGTNEAIIQIASSAGEIEVSSNMGDVCTTSSSVKDGIFNYKLIVKISEEEMDGVKSVSRIIKVKSEFGDADIKCKIAPGKQYECRFSIPPEFVYADESVTGGLYASSKAQIEFVSTIDNLNISYNDQSVIKGGMIEKNLPTFLEISKEGDTYFFRFTLNDANAQNASFLKPVFHINHIDEDGEQQQLTIKLKEGAEVKAKTSLKYRIFYKTLGGDNDSFDDLIEKAETGEKKMNFSAASEYYANALKHNDCPKEREIELDKKIKQVLKCRKIDYSATVFIQKAERFETEQGFKYDSVFIYNRAAIRCFNDLLKFYPDNTTYSKERDRLEKKLEDHPMGYTTESVTYVKKNQEITGSGYMSGIDIYKSYNGKKNLNWRDRVGRTTTDGTFRIVLKEDVPYLYFYGDKKAVRIDASTTVLNRD